MSQSEVPGGVTSLGLYYMDTHYPQPTKEDFSKEDFSKEERRVQDYRKEHIQSFHGWIQGCSFGGKFK